MTDDFHPFTPVHLIAVVSSSVVVAGAIIVRRTLPTETGRRYLDHVIATFAALVWIASTVWWALPRNYHLYGWSKSLPLQLCDFAGLAAPIAIWTGRRWARALLYCWGIGLSTQAFITPVVAFGPRYVAFWLFWLIHLAIVGSALYDVIARGFRPTWRDWRWAVFVSFGYLLVVLPVNLSLGVNYGFVGRVPTGRPTIVDALGPWPFRILPIAALAAGVMALAVLPWTVHRHRTVVCNDEENAKARSREADAKRRPEN